MRIVDGVICSTEFLARRYRKFNERQWVCPNGIDLKRYAYARPRARAGHDRLGRRRRPHRLGAAVAARGGGRAARAPERLLPYRRLDVRRRAARRVRPGALPQPPVRAARGLPGVDEHVRRRARAVGQQQPVPRQERPALARGQRARRAGRRRPRRLPRDRGRRHRHGRRLPRRGRGRAARSWSTTPRCGAASATPPTPTSSSIAASRSPRSAGPRCSARRARRASPHEPSRRPRTDHRDPWPAPAARRAGRRRCRADRVREPAPGRRGARADDGRDRVLPARRARRSSTSCATRSA